MKTCNKCKKRKSLNEFYFRKDTNKHRSECKECNKQAKALREAEPGVKELRASKERERRQLHKESINARLAKRRNTAEGKEATRKAHQKWCKNNPDKVKAYNKNAKHKRKTPKNKQDSTSKTTNWLLNEPKLCVYCGKPCHTDYHLDHITPLSKGGTHTVDNFAIACPFCNISKGAKTLIIWMAQRINRSKG